MEKVWKIEIKSGKSGKKSWLFFQSKQVLNISEIFFILVKSYPISPICLPRTMKKALFPHFLRSLMITYLTTLNLEKEILILEKSLEKVFTFGCKNLYEPWNNGNMCIARLEPPLTPPKNWLVTLCLVYSNKNDLKLIWKMLLLFGWNSEKWPLIHLLSKIFLILVFGGL